MKHWQVNQSCINHCTNGGSPRGFTVFPHCLRGQKIKRGIVSNTKFVIESIGNSPQVRYHSDLNLFIIASQSKFSICKTKFKVNPFSIAKCMFLNTVITVCRFLNPFSSFSPHLIFRDGSLISL